MAVYIEKQAAIDEVEEWYDLYPDSDAAREALSFLKRFIKKLPPADVRPVVRGRWIRDGEHHARCSACGDRWTVRDGNPLAVVSAWNYCTNCGADMRGYECE